MHLFKLKKWKIMEIIKIKSSINKTKKRIKIIDKILSTTIKEKKNFYDIIKVNDA